MRMAWCADRILFFTETEKGETFLADLPPGAVPRIYE